MQPFDDFQTFLTAWWDGKPHPMGYTKSEGKGRVAYLANGHDPRSLAHPTVGQLVIRAIRWARGEEWANKTVKVAAIGYGGAFNMGKLHLESAQRAGLTPVAVCDVDPKRAATAKTEIGEHILTSHRIDDLLCNSDAELVVVITPHNTHAPLAVQCLESGRHVITEKPFTITVDEATQVIETARRHRKMATVFHNRRWDGDFIAIKKIIASGAIGEVFHIECCFSNYDTPKTDWWRAYKEVTGSALHDWGAHFVDWILQLLPHKIESVSGDHKKFKWPQVSIEDFASAYVRFEGGRSASLEAGHVAAIGKSRWRILGTLGGIEQKGWDMKDGLRVVSHRDGYKSDAIVPIGASDWDGFYRNVADHLLLGEALAVTPESARKVIAVVDLAERSSKQGGAPIALPFEQ
jgi:predicted dehydrogenase